MTSRVPFLVHDLAHPVSDAYAGGVIAIGNFDGVHRGHQSVLDIAINKARELNKPAFALSFEPHPRTLFKPESPVFRLTPQAMKAHVLDQFGLDGLLGLNFTKDLAATPAEEFVQQFIVDHARAAHVITGFNFHFGKGREGSPAFLQERGQKYGYGVTIADGFEDESSEIISSSRIRRCLGAGDVIEAAGLLGYRWCVSGKVIKGAQLGRTLNYPTANIEPEPNCRLAHGIYAVRLRTQNGVLHNGVASYGRRPTFDNGRPLLETFIFDFDEDIYGQDIFVSLAGWIRGEEKFDSAEALVEQMDLDSEHAKAMLASLTPLSELDQKLTFDGLRA